jgi:hypothetical protein
MIDVSFHSCQEEVVGMVEQTTDSYAPMFGHTPPFCQRHLGSSDNQK